MSLKKTHSKKVTLKKKNIVPKSSNQRYSFWDSYVVHLHVWEECLLSTFFFHVVNEAWQKKLQSAPFRFREDIINNFAHNGYDDEIDWPDLTNEDLSELGVVKGFFKKWRRVFPDPSEVNVSCKKKAELQWSIVILFTLKKKKKLKFSTIKFFLICCDSKNVTPTFFAGTNIISFKMCFSGCVAPFIWLF